MGFFDDLNRFAQDIRKSLKPEEIIKLKSCKNCNYYRKGYCTQTSPPTHILSEYYAQGCIYYTTEEAVISSRTGGTVTVDELKKGTIDNLKKIGFISPAIYVGNRGQLMNPDFEEWYHEEGRTPTEYIFQGWTDPEGKAKLHTDNVYTGFSALTLKKGSGSLNGIFQTFSPPIPTNDIDVFTIQCLNLDEVQSGEFKIRMFYSDGEKKTEGYVVDELPLSGGWDKFDITPDADKYLTSMRIFTVDDVFTDWDVLILDLLSLRYKSPERIKGIETIEGTNLFIDLLKSSAYTPLRRTIENNADSGYNWESAVNDARKGKFFPRGCRGFLNKIEVYCRDAGSSGGTITVYLSPHPSMGYIASANITLDPSVAGDWRSAIFRKMWNYDSLFISLVCSSNDIDVAQDTDEPYDFYSSSDQGKSWLAESYRLWARAVMRGQTVGDVPVSGIINNIKIPSSGSYKESGVKIVAPTTEVTLVTIEGAGTCDLVVFSVASAVDSHNTLFRVYCDDIVAFKWSPFVANDFGATATTPKVSLTRYAVDGICVMWVSKIFEFTQELKLTARSYSVADLTCIGQAFPNLLS